MIYETAPPSIYLYFYFHASSKDLYISFYIRKQVSHGCIFQFINICKKLFPNPITIYWKCACNKLIHHYSEDIRAVSQYFFKNMWQFKIGMTWKKTLRIRKLDSDRCYPSIVRAFSVWQRDSHYGGVSEEETQKRIF